MKCGLIFIAILFLNSGCFRAHNDAPPLRQELDQDEIFGVPFDCTQLQLSLIMKRAGIPHDSLQSSLSHPQIAQVYRGLPDARMARGLILTRFVFSQNLVVSMELEYPASIYAAICDTSPAANNWENRSSLPVSKDISPFSMFTFYMKAVERA